jgi:hypothetical protein
VLCSLEGEIDLRINISVPASVLDEVDIQVEKPLGRVRLHVEDDWLIVKALASTIKIRPRVETGNIILQGLEVSGLLWPVRSMIEKSIEDSVKKTTIPNLLSMSIRDKKIELLLSVGAEIPPFLRKFIEKSPPA